MKDEEDVDDDERREAEGDWDDLDLEDNETTISSDIDDLIVQSMELPND